MQNEIEFDNIYISNDPDDASSFASKTWVLKQQAEFIATNSGLGTLQKITNFVNSLFKEVLCVCFLPRYGVHLVLRNGSCV